MLTRVSIPSGARIDFEYDDWGNLVRASREAILDETYTYHETDLEDRHLLSSLTDQRRATTSYEWTREPISIDEITIDGAFVRSVTRPEGGKVSFDYDLTNLRTTVTDPRQFDTIYQLDAYGSAVRVEDPEGNVKRTRWREDVLPEKITDGNNHVTIYTYDEHGNQLVESITVHDFVGDPTTYERRTTYYPPDVFEPPHIKNRPRKIADRDGNETFFVYDERGNLTEQRLTVTGVDGNSEDLITVNVYLPNGDLRSTTNPRGNTTFFEYDLYGNVSKVTDPLLGITETKWTMRGLPFEHTDAENRVTKITYDALGRQTRKTLPPVEGEAIGAAVERTVYNDFQRTTTEVDAEGRVTVTTYDREGRPIEIVNAEGGTKVFVYDEDGNQRFESRFFDDETPRVDTEYQYDKAGRLVRRIEPLGRETLLEYDSVGNVVREELVDTSGSGFVPRVAEADYDALNRPIRIRQRLIEEGVERWVEALIAYNGEGDKVLEVDPLGRETRFEYDEAHRLLRMIEPQWKEDEHRVTENVFDKNGNLVQSTLFNEPQNRVRYQEWDDLDRLKRVTDAEGGVEHLSYDHVGNITMEITARGDVIKHGFDARNRRIRRIVAIGRVTEPERDIRTTFHYDKVGNLLREEQPNGNVIVHEYDDLNRRISTVDDLGPVSTMKYDARGNVVEATDGRGLLTVHHYDELDRLDEQILPAERTITTSWDIAGNKIAETNARGHRSVFEYDELNRLVKTIDPDPFADEASFTYDAAGNRLTETDRRGNVTSFEYDELNRLVRRIEPLLEGTEEPLTLEYTHDAAGNRLTEIDRRGILNEYFYDRENRRTTTKRAGLEILFVTYDENGNIATQRDARGKITAFEYDERDLPITENRPLAAVTRYKYDDMGDQVETIDPEQRLVTRTYDKRRRLSTETIAAHGDRPEVTTYDYDGNGNRTSVLRPEGNEQILTYDDANRLETILDGENGLTTYEYDKNGNIRFQLDGNQNSTELQYDELDRLTKRIFPDGAFEETGYDENGNVASFQDANERITTHQYDALNRLVLTTLPEDPSTEDDLESIGYVYDENNNLLETRESFVLSGMQPTISAYDDFDRLESKTDRWDNKIVYAYDANGNRTGLWDPQDRATIYGFDDLNRLESVITRQTATVYKYFRDGRLKEIQYPNNVSAAYTYDDAGRVASITNRKTSTLISGFEYQYDKNGNRVEQIEEHAGASSETTVYEYDGADRLEKVTYPDKTVTYTYDAVGNRETEQHEVGGAPGDQQALFLHAARRDRRDSRSARSGGAGDRRLRLRCQRQPGLEADTERVDELRLRRAGSDRSRRTRGRCARDVCVRRGAAENREDRGIGRGDAVCLRRSERVDEGDRWSRHEVRLWSGPSAGGQRSRALRGAGLLPLRRPAQRRQRGRRAGVDQGAVQVGRLGERAGTGRIHRFQPVRFHRARARRGDRADLCSGAVLRSGNRTVSLARSARR